MLIIVICYFYIKSFHNAIGVNLVGGFGNQMFQIATGYALAKRYKCDFFINDIQESIHNNKLSMYIISKFKNKNQINKNILVNMKNYYENKEFTFNEITDTNIILNGLFQHQQYFIDCNESIYEILTPPKYIIDKLSKFDFNNIVAIHVRLGDFLIYKEIHKINLKNYYEKAKKYIETKLINPKYVIVSENTKTEVLEHYPIFSNYDFINELENGDEMFDFYFMSKCTGLITCNSTFSWWAGFIAQNAGFAAKGNVIIPNNYILKKDSSIHMQNATVIEI